MSLSLRTLLLGFCCVFSGCHARRLQQFLQSLHSHDLGEEQRLVSRNTALFLLAFAPSASFQFSLSRGKLSFSSSPATSHLPISTQHRGGHNSFSMSDVVEEDNAYFEGDAINASLAAELVEGIAGDAVERLLEDRAYSNPAPNYVELINDAANAAEAAIADGHRLLEVQFPIFSASKMESDSISITQTLQQNLQYAFMLSERISQTPDGDIRKVYLTVTDSQSFKEAAKFIGKDVFDLTGGIHSVMGDSWLPFVGGGDTAAADGADMYIVVDIPSRELFRYRKLAEELAPNAIFIFMNTDMDQRLRGDLGLPFFSPRSFHNEFLCKVKPVYFMRNRDYGLTLTQDPWLFSYSGVLYRCYPGPWCSLLRAGNSKYRVVEAAKDRPTLASFKTTLWQSCKISDEMRRAVTSPMSFQGGTWWETETFEKDDEDTWRT